ncbi:MAG: hypothetical protein GX579_18850 [Chloroflexi bacterium]|jgi:hypothetical protein|nr:hypothetical protein [Chloroflexota bacterium]
MQLTGIHVVLTYQCQFECGHCFIWGRGGHSGIFHPDGLAVVLDQAAALGTIKEICFEGGETFVYYPLLIAAVRSAASRRFRPAVITNGYWANSAQQARLWLERLVTAGLQRILFVAEGLGGAAEDLTAHPAVVVSQEMGLDTAIIGAGERAGGQMSGLGQAGWPQLTCGRVRRTPGDGALYPWTTFTTCPYEQLASPSHVHIDPFGDVHLCRGLIIGNIFDCPLASIAAYHAPERHPIVGPLLTDGPAGLVTRYGLQPESAYTAACQLCRHSLAQLWPRFPTRRAGQPAIGGAPCED